MTTAVSGRRTTTSRDLPILALSEVALALVMLFAVLGLRLLPIVPFNALNYAFGLSAVTRRDHVVGTAVGIVPGSVAFVALGDSITDPTSPGFIASVAGIALLVAAGTWRRRRRPHPPPPTRVSLKVSRAGSHVRH